MRKNNLKIILFMSLLVFNVPSSAQEINRENFELTLIVNFSSNSPELRIKMAGYLQQALAPLGIKVTIVKENVNDFLNHLYSPVNDKWDMALVRNAPSVPLFIYDFSTEINPSFIGLDDVELEKLLLEDAGTNLNEFKQRVLEFEVEFNSTEQMKKSDNLSQFYLDELLFEYPLVNEKRYIFVSNDYQYTDPNIHMMNSLYLGGSLIRDTNKPDNVLRISTGHVNDYRSTLFNNLVLFDNLGVPHPDLAVQWELSDWVMDNGTIIEKGKNTFLIRDDAYFSPMNFSGPTTFSPINLGLKDFEFTYWLNQNTHLWPYGQNYEQGAWFYQGYNSSLKFPLVEFNYTENTMSIYSTSPKPTDLRFMNEWYLYPEMLFNTTLHYQENDGTYTNGTPSELLALGKNPKYSDELFQYFWNSIWWTGEIMTTEAYSDISFRPGGIISDLRDLYHFPSELDSPEQDFILHEPGPEEAYFFAYNTTETSPNQKPTTIPISRIDWTWETPSNVNEAELILKGELDAIGLTPDNRNVELLEELKNDPNLYNFKLLKRQSGQMLMFDLSNPHLAKYDVRRAIASAINKDVLEQLNYGEIERWDNPVWPILDQQYNPAVRIDYDYTYARDLMRGKGYWAAEAPDFSVKKVKLLPQTSITVPKDASAPALYIIISIGVFGLLKRKKKLN